MADKINIQEHLLQSASELSNSNRMNPKEKKKHLAEKRKKVSEDDIVNMIDSDMSIDEIAEEFSLSTASIGQYLERGLKKRRISVDLEKIISPERQRDLEQRILSLNSSSIKKIVDTLKGDFEEWEIRVVRGILIAQHSNEFE